MEINKRDPPSSSHRARSAVVGGSRIEVGVERKLHSTFVWSEKSIKLLSCELHGKERPRNTQRTSLVIIVAFFYTTAERRLQVVACGQSEKGKNTEK